MTPKRGQPPKPPEKRRDIVKRIRYSPEEVELLESAYKLSESKNSFSRWMANITLEEARRIVEDSKK